MTPAHIFQEKIVPRGTKLAGWSFLVEQLDIRAPVRHPSCVSEQYVGGNRKEEKEWSVFDKRYAPGKTFADHLNFAFRNEELELPILKLIFEAVPKAKIEALVRAAPTGIHARRIWYLYETLTGRKLKNPDARSVVAVDLLDPKLYFTGQPRLSKRHRVRDNLLGCAAFCPIIRRTPLLEKILNRKLAAKARETVGRTGAHLVARAASFMLLADSRASFEIEGERPPRTRLERWGRAVLQAGKNQLTLDELTRLHAVLIESNRFIKAGLRSDGVFLGGRDHHADPLPEFIGARPQDLKALMGGLLEANERMRLDEIDPILQAAATAFGFVYVHPFEDGNGRMHRCLIHHVLAERKFMPPGMVFPVSSVMLDRIDEYRGTLQAHSGALMPFIDWKPTLQRNVEVTNETADLYRYFDCTQAAEFLCACVAHTIEYDLPREIDYLKRHDEALRAIMNAVEMPDRVAQHLIALIRQNNGTLAKRRHTGEFKMLKKAELTEIEGIVKEAFAGFEGTTRERASTA